MESHKIKIIKKGSIIISNDNCELCDIIKKNLTRKFKNYHNENKNEINKFFDEDETNLYIPVFYPIENLIDCDIVNERTDGDDIEIECNTFPRNKLQEETLDYMLNHDNGIIELDTGSGKTIITIMAISKLKKKTLILLHRTNLVEQWINQFKKFTNIDDNISVLNNSKIRESFSNPIVISTVQSFMMALKNRKNELLTELYNANFGILVSDELHVTTGAKKFSECSLYIPVKRRFGLSATPKRYDGTSDILQYHMGKIYKPEGESGIMKAKVNIIFFNFGLLPKSYKYIYWNSKFQRTRYLNLLKKSDKLNKVCLELLYKLKDRNIFIIIERIKFVEQLFKAFECDDKSTYIETDKNDNLKSRVVFATPGKVRDGIDEPNKDCLIMTSPIGNITQICGRVVRTVKDKKEPVIFDLVDIGCPDISKTVYRRIEFYHDKEWEVNYFKIDGSVEKVYDIKSILDHK